MEISKDEMNNLKEKLQEKLNPPVKKENKVFTIFLFTIMICLSVAVSYVLFLKSTESKKVPEKIVPIVPDNPNVDINFLKNSITKLTIQNKRLSDQVWLLGLQANQNAVVLKMATPPNAYRVSEMSEDWKLNRIPDRVNMKPEYISKLREFLSPPTPRPTSLEEEADMPFPIEE